MSSLPVVAIFGPTGVGKTDVAIALAELLHADGEDPAAVSADALQIYAGLEIVTGAATAAERARLEHRLVGVLPVTETFSAGGYAERAHAEVDGLLAAGRRPIVVGGTGLYLRAALAELDLRPPPAPGVRERWQAELQARGAPELHAALSERDPEAAARIAPTDAQRLVRALELLDAGHAPPGPRPASGVAPAGAGPAQPGRRSRSEATSPGTAPSLAPSELWTADTRHPTLLAGLVMERAALYERIDARVDAMIAAGAVEEVRRADAAGASSTARKAIGFEELLRGDVDAMKRRSRNYAKRQLTWMRKLPAARVLDITGRTPEDVAAELRSGLRSRA